MVADMISLIIIPKVWLNRLPAFRTEKDLLLRRLPASPIQQFTQGRCHLYINQAVRFLGHTAS